MNNFLNKINYAINNFNKDKALENFNSVETYFLNNYDLL